MEEGQYPHLFNSRTTDRGMFATAVPTGGNLYAHTLSSTFHILLAQTQNISTCKIKI